MTANEEIAMLIAQISEWSAELVISAGHVASLVADQRDRQQDLTAGLRIISRQTMEKAQFFNDLADRLGG